MAKERPATAGGKTANNRGRHPAVPPARTAPAAATPGPRRPASANPAQGSPADPRPIPPPFLTHQEPAPDDTADVTAEPQPQAAPRPDAAATAQSAAATDPSAANAGPDAAGTGPGAADPGPDAAPSHPNAGAGRTDAGAGDPDAGAGRADAGAGRADAATTRRDTAPAPHPRAADVPHPAPGPRSDLPKRGVARVPSPRPLLPGLQLQPMVHVADMPDAVAFYERLGGEIVHGDRDGEWVLMQVGTAQIGLVTRPPDPARGESTVELNFSATMPLERLEKMLRDRGVTVVRLAVDPDLGTRLHVETPDGMPVKIHQVEPDLLI